MIVVVRICKLIYIGEVQIAYIRIKFLKFNSIYTFLFCFSFFTIMADKVDLYILILEKLEKAYSLGKHHKSPNLWVKIQAEISEENKIELPKNKVYEKWAAMLG